MAGVAGVAGAAGEAGEAGEVGAAGEVDAASPRRVTRSGCAAGCTARLCVII